MGVEKAQRVLLILFSVVDLSRSFILQPLRKSHRLPHVSPSTASSLRLFDKIFEESGPLGKGITVGKVQVALFCRDRSRDSIVGFLRETTERQATSSSSSSAALARLANEVCIQLLRKSDDWTAACSDSQWFSQKDSAKAESFFNDLTNREAVKFEKEYRGGVASDGGGGESTQVVVSLVVEIQGDSVRFEGAGYSLASTKEVLTSLAGDAMVEGGDCVNAVELFWTPADSDEVLTRADMVLDFPELIDL